MLGIIQLLQHFNWTFINVVYSKGSYGSKATESLKDEAKRHSICLDLVRIIHKQDPISTYDKIVRDFKRSLARVVVVYLDQEELHMLFSAVIRADLVDNFTWVGSDGLGLNTDDMQGVESVAQRALALRTQTSVVEEFQDYFKNLNPDKVPGNPWFKDMWKIMFDCTWNFNCDKTKTVGDSNLYDPEGSVGKIIDIVYAFAEAASNIINQDCPDATGDQLYHCLRGKKIYSQLRKLSFKG